jgi:hypothetical protein
MYTLETPTFLNSYTHYQADAYNSGPQSWMTIAIVAFVVLFLIALIGACLSGGSSTDRSRSRRTNQVLEIYNPGTTYQDWGIAQYSGGNSDLQPVHCYVGHIADHHHSHNHDHNHSHTHSHHGGC